MFSDSEDEEEVVQPVKRNRTFFQDSEDEEEELPLEGHRGERRSGNNTDSSSSSSGSSGGSSSSSSSHVDPTAAELVNNIINTMRAAAQEDRELNRQRRPALRKVRLLPQLMGHLKKANLVGTFMACGLMKVIKEWISPLPDRSLPALQIRVELLKLLMWLPTQSARLLKDSGIAHAVVFLQKHPKESQGNKDLTYQLIHKWMRELFGASSDYQKMLKEQPERRNSEPQRRLLSSEEQSAQGILEKSWKDDAETLKPNDSGATRHSTHCVRAQVPMQSQMVYKVRPTWNVRAKSSWCPVAQQCLRMDTYRRKLAKKRQYLLPKRSRKISTEENVLLQ